MKRGVIALVAAALALSLGFGSSVALERHPYRRHHRHHRMWDPSGQPMPIGDVPGWHQVFADNFAGEKVPRGAFSACSWPATTIVCAGLASFPAVHTKWFAYPDGWSDFRYGTYYPSRVLSISNGVMDYYLHTEAINGIAYHMVAAPVAKLPTGAGNAGGELYGRYVVRARFDSLPGYHVAFLLWPDSGNWPADGEIDFPDDALNDSTINAFVHDGTSSFPRFDHFGAAGTINRWHTYEIDWLSTGVSFYLDGRLIGTDTAHIPATPMHWVLQTDTWSGGSPPSDATAGHVQIDWATVYTPT
jgi:hypothetical protein